MVKYDLHDADSKITNERAEELIREVHGQVIDGLTLPFTGDLGFYFAIDLDYYYSIDYSDNRHFMAYIVTSDCIDFCASTVGEFYSAIFEHGLYIRKYLQEMNKN